jgi:hypothetical protein
MVTLNEPFISIELKNVIYRLSVFSIPASFIQSTFVQPSVAKDTWQSPVKINQLINATPSLFILASYI